MAQIDALLTHMRDAGTSRAILRGDAPSQLQNRSGVSQGNVIPNSTLETTINEIAPPEAQETLKSFGAADFQYNGFLFRVTVADGLLNFDVSPTAYAGGPTPMASGISSVGANNSGEGTTSTLPPEATGFNWGAFLLPWIWPLAHNTWIGLLSFIPIVGFFMRFFLGFKGNELGWKNRKFTSLDQFKQVQKTWLIAGLVTTIVGGCGMFPITAAILFPVFARARENARRSSCQSNLKQISLGVMQYVQDYDEVYPIANSDERFKQDLQRYLMSEEIFECPTETTKGVSDYVYNKALVGMKVEEINDPAKTPMIWDKETTEHLGGRNIAFADGHVQWLREDNAQELLAPYR